jgi:hypothetical protein
VRACTDVRALPYHPGRRHRGTYRAGQTEEHVGRGRQGRALSAPPGQTGHGYLQCRDAYSARLQGSVLQQEQGHVKGHWMTWWAIVLAQAVSRACL